MGPLLRRRPRSSTGGRWSCSARPAYQSLFPNVDPIGKKVRIGANEFTVIGVLGKRPSPGGFKTVPDDFVVIPYTAHEKFYGKVLEASGYSAGDVNERRSEPRMIVDRPRDGATREQAHARGGDDHADPPRPEARPAERLRPRRRRTRMIKVWDQFTQATSSRWSSSRSIALMVGGIGVMAIMMISVTERTREIGVRKALGARRREILWQFLIEAAFLTSVGGLLGIVCGSAIGLLVHWLSGFPVSLPWWSFALGIGFSAASASSSASSPPSRPRGWTRSRRCATSSGQLQLQLVSSQLQLPAGSALSLQPPRRS